MNNYYGQMPTQYNQRQMSNKMLNDYKKMNTNNTPFINNQMLNNNPAFFANIKDNSYYQKMNIEKMERMRKIKSADELGISKEKLTDFVICPIKVEKENNKEIARKYGEKSMTYVATKKKGKDTIPDFLDKLFQGRTNNPYKNIIKDEDYTKNFKKKEDLIVHKVTSIDKNLIKTMAEFEEMMDFIEIHDGELEIKYSKAKENKYKEKFDYENKIKYRIKYDPKNYGDLKKFYKKEQKKIKKTSKRFDEMIEMLLVSENFTKEELDEINKPFEDEEDVSNITMVFEKADAKMGEQMEKELEKELIEEFGEEGLDELIKEYVGDDDNETTKNSGPREKIRVKDNSHTKKKIDIEETKTEVKTKKPLITIKSKVPQTNTEEVAKSDLSIGIVDNSSNVVKKKITLKPKKIDEQINKPIDKPINAIGYVDDDELAEFKSQQKKKIKNTE